MPTYLYSCPEHGRQEVVKPMDDAGRMEFCPACAEHFREHKYRGGFSPCPYGPMRRVYTPQRLIMRPSGYRLKPGDKGFDDFRREMELGELRDDPTPLQFTPEELARMDEMPLAMAPDPARDHQFAQLIHQHWTEDLSDDTVRRRALEAQHYATAHGQPAAG